MPHADFVHLRVHTAYSLSEGAIKIKELVGICKKLQMPAVAVTDTGNLFGALEFAIAAPRTRHPADHRRHRSASPRADDGVGRPASAARPCAEPDRLVLLAQNEAGYANLMALTSRAYLETEQGLAPQLALEDLAGPHRGLDRPDRRAGGPVGRLLLAEAAGARRWRTLRD